jgi:hypothetical protein
MKNERKSRGYKHFFFLALEAAAALARCILMGS